MTVNGNGGVFNGNFNITRSRNSQNNSDLSTKSPTLPSSVPSTSPDSSKAVIAESVVGAVAFIFCRLFALVLFHKRKNKQKNRETLITPLPYQANLFSFAPKIRGALRDQQSPLPGSAGGGMTEHPTTDIQAQLTRILRRLDTLEANGSERVPPLDYVSIH
ncbi:hypothetical protein PQX77_017552 [Marasmius sp. AFHP31]|nr:hypothetical protein PQX77_017552 [Marasmius sp. AFHP31]